MFHGELILMEIYIHGGDVVEAGTEAILNELGTKQSAYILNWVGRVTRWTLA